MSIRPSDGKDELLYGHTWAIRKSAIKLITEPISSYTPPIPWKENDKIIGSSAFIMTETWYFICLSPY